MLVQQASNSLQAESHVYHEIKQQELKLEPVDQMATTSTMTLFMVDTVVTRKTLHFDFSLFNDHTSHNIVVAFCAV